MSSGTIQSVLLVDDEPDNLEVVAETLEFHGVEVKTAGNGLECLAILEQWLPDIVLLDLSMPLLDGWETLKRIRAEVRTQKLRVVALSAHAALGDGHDALERGFSGYMTKPVKVPTIMQDLQKALKQAG